MEAQTIDYAIPLFELQFAEFQVPFLSDNARKHDCFPPNPIRASIIDLEVEGNHQSCGKDSFRISTEIFRNNQQVGLKTLVSHRKIGESQMDESFFFRNKVYGGKG